MKKIVILGSTGSVGRQCLQVVDELPNEFEVIGLSGGTNVKLLAEQVNKYKPPYVCIVKEKDTGLLKELINAKTEVFNGSEGLVNLARLDEADLIVVAVSGINGLEPTLTALAKKTTVALANKETIVTAGSIVMEASRKYGTRIIPVDSEHSAIFQCLQGNSKESVEKLILTASGGPFIKYSHEELAKVTPEMALSHPTWKMGAKITVDCAGLINKGLEVIEAHWLFGMPYDSIEVVIHPQSIIHSMVQYSDGAVMAQIGCPDMRVPIQYAFTYPLRIKNTFPRMNFYELNGLTFIKPDVTKFLGLSLAYYAGKAGGTMPTVYNGANEEAVYNFLNGRIGFTGIPKIVEKVMAAHDPLEKFNLSDILEIDGWARRKTRELIGKS